MTSASLKGFNAMVTGASSGIGAGIAKALAASGAKVCVNYSRDNVGAEAVVEEILRAGGSGFAVKADVSQEASVLELFARAAEQSGPLDLLVNNAGVQKDARLTEMTLEQWNTVIGINLTGQFLCAREAVRGFLKRARVAGKARGRIVCISSVHDIIPWAGHANYAASKAGASMLMKTLAQELAQEGVRVNAVSPGAIKTRINKEAWSTHGAEKDLLKLIPYGRVGEVEDIGRACVWLASDESDYVNGATLYVDGGMTLFPEFRGNG